MEQCKLEANRAYDALIQMGGRQTHLIQCNLHCKTVLFGGEQFYQDTEEDEELFYYGTAEPRHAPHPMEVGVIVSHWVAERMQFVEELQGWQDFATLNNMFASIIQKRQEKTHHDESSCREGGPVESSRRLRF